MNPATAAPPVVPCFAVDPSEFRRVHGCHPSAVEGQREWLYEVVFPSVPASLRERHRYRGPYVGLLLTVLQSFPGVNEDGTLVILD